MIIVTGGAGFIGSYVAAELQAKGYKDIVIVDRLGSDDKWKNIAKRELRAIVAPEETFSFLEEHKTEITAVIHMGAISTTTEKDADLIIRSNFQLSQKLWYFCCENNVQYIYASSAATYGDGTACGRLIPMAGAKLCLTALPPGKSWKDARFPNNMPD